MKHKKYSDIEGAWNARVIEYLRLYGYDDPSIEWCVTEKVHGSNFSFYISVDEIKMVLGGGERAVMIYKPSEWKKDTIKLGKVTFTNMNTEKKVEKDYYFAEGIYEEVPNYIEVCNYNENLFNDGTKTF